jgi:1,4-alpha-glucan branching enzyme
MAGKTKIKKVQFQFLAPEAKKAYLVGDFNNWDISVNPMKKNKNGIWKTALSLMPGRYEYRFLVDGNWENDPACSCCVPNEFGSENCVRIVD